MGSGGSNSCQPHATVLSLRSLVVLFCFDNEFIFFFCVWHQGFYPCKVVPVPDCCNLKESFLVNLAHRSSQEAVLEPIPGICGSPQCGTTSKHPPASLSLVLGP